MSPASKALHNQVPFIQTLKTWFSLSPSCRLYEPEAGVEQSRDLTLSEL
jgi:hypothetical protein